MRHLNIYALRRASNNNHYVVGMDDSGTIKVDGPVISFNKKFCSPYDKRPARLRIGTEEISLGLDYLQVRLGAPELVDVWNKFLTEKNLTDAGVPQGSFYQENLEVPSKPVVSPQKGKAEQELDDWKISKGREIHICHLRLPKAMRLGLLMDSPRKMLHVVDNMKNVLSDDPEGKKAAIKTLLAPAPSAGMTMAFALKPIMDGDQEHLYIRFGYALCSEKDLFNRKTGRNLAMRRLKDFKESIFGHLYQGEYANEWYLNGSGDLIVKAPHSTVKKYGDHYEVASPSYHRLGMIRSVILRAITKEILEKSVTDELRIPTSLLAMLGASNDLEMVSSGYDPLKESSWTSQTPGLLSDEAKQKTSEEFRLSLYYAMILRMIVARKGPTGGMSAVDFMMDLIQGRGSPESSEKF